MVPRSLVVDSLEIYEISDEVRKFITKAMKNCKGEFTAGGKTSTEVKIQRGIFQGDEFLLLLLIRAIMALNYILEEYTEELQIY